MEKKTRCEENQNDDDVISRVNRRDSRWPASRSRGTRHRTRSDAVYRPTAPVDGAAVRVDVVTRVRGLHAEEVAEAVGHAGLRGGGAAVRGVRASVAARGLQCARRVSVALGTRGRRRTYVNVRRLVARDALVARVGARRGVRAAVAVALGRGRVVGTVAVRAGGRVVPVPGAVVAAAAVSARVVVRAAGGVELLGGVGVAGAGLVLRRCRVLGVAILVDLGLELGLGLGV